MDLYEKESLEEEESASPLEDEPVNLDLKKEPTSN